MSPGRKIRLSAEQVEEIARALAEPRRFAILKQIATQRSMTCSALDEHECISAATISHHLKALTDAGLIDAAREGRVRNLSLRREVWDAYLRELSTF